MPFEILKAWSLDNRGWSNFPQKQFSQNLQMICELLGYHLLTSVAFTNRPTHFVVPTSMSAFKHLMSFFESIIERDTWHSKNWALLIEVWFQREEGQFLCFGCWMHACMQFYIQMTTEMAPKKWSPTRCMLLFALWNSSIVGWRYRRGRSGGRVQRPTRKWLLWLALFMVCPVSAGLTALFDVVC